MAYQLQFRDVVAQQDAIVDAKALGVKLELTQITGVNRLPFLLTDEVDIVMSESTSPIVSTDGFQRRDVSAVAIEHEDPLKAMTCRRDGPVVVVSGGVHGDEYEGPAVIGQLIRGPDRTTPS